MLEGTKAALCDVVTRSLSNNGRAPNSHNMTSFTSCRDGYSSKPFLFKNCISCEFCQNFNFILSFYKHSCKGLLGQNKNRTLTTFRAVLVSSVRSPEIKLLFFLRRTAFFPRETVPYCRILIK